MKIISWNCNGKFREKYRYILDYYPDVMVIQECEDPSFSINESYIEFAAGSVWKGDEWVSNSLNKGLGIFVKPGVKVKVLDWPGKDLKYFLPVRINDSFNFIAVWAYNQGIPAFYDYMMLNFERIDCMTVVMGDFNSNAIWDADHGAKCHSAVVDRLSEKGLISAYHECFGEKQGAETSKSMYLFSKDNKGFLTDHCFVSPGRIKDFTVMSSEKFIQRSNHIPICVNID